MNYAAEQRIRLIDFLLAHYGHVGRMELCDFYGISEPCASRDLAVYNEVYPGNMAYDASTKRWCKTFVFQRAYP